MAEKKKPAKCKCCGEKDCDCGPKCLGCPGAILMCSKCGRCGNCCAESCGDDAAKTK